MSFLVKDSRHEPTWTLTLSLIPFVMVNVKFVLGWFGIGEEVDVTSYTGACALALAPILVRKGINSASAVADKKAEATVKAAAVAAKAEVKAAAVVAEAKVDESSEDVAAHEQAATSQKEAAVVQAKAAKVQKEAAAEQTEAAELQAEVQEGRKA